jgi:hypothetical protein
MWNTRTREERRAREREEHRALELIRHAYFFEIMGLDNKQMRYSL